MMSWIKKNQKLVWLVAAVFIILIFIFLRQPIRSVFHSISGSLESWCWERGQSGSNFWAGFFNASNLKDENQNLKRENRALLANLLDFQELQEENQRLRLALDLGLAQDFSLKEAAILTEDLAGDYLVINKGSEDGIIKEMTVITYEKVLVGKITEVHRRSSRVRLLTDAGIKFSVKIADTNIQALAKGEGNEKITLDLMPKDVEVPIGALVFTSGHESGYQPNLLVGVIAKTSTTDIEPFQKAEVEDFFKIQEATLLFVITD